MPAAALPVVAPVQNRAPTMKRTTQTRVSQELTMVRRPRLSVVRDHSKTARRLQQLKRKMISKDWVVGMLDSPQNDSAEEWVV